MDEKFYLVINAKEEGDFEGLPLPITFDTKEQAEAAKQIMQGLYAFSGEPDQEIRIMTGEQIEEMQEELDNV